jgi:4'-phosphopantetheinyl transferase
MGNSMEIPSGEVHVWWASLAVSDTEVARLRSLLDGRELERANRFRVARARRRFIAARAALRSILGAATGTEPGSLVFAYGERGKPRLAHGGPCFNASDSGDFVAVALAAAEVGIDVEVRRPLPRHERFARRICTERELAALGRVPESGRDAALLRLWTCKEAALKANGVGLSGGVRNVEVELGLDGAPHLRSFCGDAERWQLLWVDLGTRLVCSVVVRGRGFSASPRSFTFPGR